MRYASRVGWAVLVSISLAVSTTSARQESFYLDGEALGVGSMGIAVGASAGRALVGAPGLGNGTAVYQDTATGNVLDQYVSPFPPNSTRPMGIDVALSGNNALLARDGGIAGIAANQALYYDAASGEHQETYNWGQSVDIDGDMALIGGYQEAHLVNLNTGSSPHSFSGSTNSTSQYGFDVAIGGDYAAVSNYGANSYQGDVTIYDSVSGALVDIIGNPNAENDYFGYAIDISGNTMVVGSPFGNVAGANSNEGLAFVYDLPTMSLLHTLSAPNALTQDRFGTSVAIDGDLIVVGADMYDVTAENAGAAFVYDAQTGALLRTLVASNGMAGDAFGSSVAIDNGTVIVGAPDRNDYFGGAYVYNNVYVACDFNGDGLCDIDDIDSLIMEIAAGTNDPTYDLDGDGVVDVADRDEWLTQAGALNLASGNPYLVADFTLDGFVDGTDFIVWNANKFSATAKWSLGDANGDGVTDGQDFIAWNENKFMSADGVSAVPEPGLGVLLIAAVFGLAMVRRR